MNLDELRRLYQQRFHSPAQVFARAPGRVNLLGEHVDYNDGPVLPAAIDRQVILAAAPLASRQISLYAADLGEEICFDLDAVFEKRDLAGEPLPIWALYPAGVAWALQQASLAVGGMQVVYSSDIPIGAGLSSSAAVEVGFAVLWQAMGGWKLTPLRLAQLCQQAENLYVGVSCGLMDQFASACGVAEHALYFDTRSLDYHPVPLPQNTALVIADSGLRRELAASAYNQRRQACEQAVAFMRQHMPEIHALRDVPATEFAARSYDMPDEIRRRGEHVIKEIARVKSAVSALQRQDKQAFGALMYASHKSLRDLYEVSTPELDTLVGLTRHLPGCIGARLTGAGFGGCTINLVESKFVDTFIEGLVDGYEQASGRRAQVYLCQASQGASLLL